MQKFMKFTVEQKYRAQRRLWNFVGILHRKDYRCLGRLQTNRNHEDVNSTLKQDVEDQIIDEKGSL